MITPVGFVTPQRQAGTPPEAGGLRDGLMAFWKFNGDLTDDSGNSRTLTAYGVKPPEFIEDGPRRGVRIYPNGHVKGNWLQTNTLKTASSNFTVAFWHRFVTAIATGYYGDRGCSLLQHYVGFGVTTSAPNSGNMTRLVLSDLATWGASSATGVLQVGTWQHIVVRVTNGTGEGFIDGVKVVQTGAGQVMRFNATQRGFGVGGDTVDGTVNNGSVQDFDCLAVWSRALTSVEIAELHNGGGIYEAF
jgi:hypothetical protein